MVNKHPDIKANHVLAVMAMRGDLNKTTVTKVTKVGLKERIDSILHQYVPYTCCGINFALLLLWADHYPDFGDRTGSGRSIGRGQCCGGEKVQCSCSQEASRGKEPSLSADSAKPLLLVWTITSVYTYNYYNTTTSYL